MNNDRESHFPDLDLADPHYLEPGKVEILLGANAYAVILRSGVKSLKQTALVAQQTSVGWIVTGAIERPFPLHHRSQTLALSSHIEEDISNDMLRKLWEFEELSSGKPLSAEEIECERSYIENYRRNSDGSYTVLLRSSL